MLAYFCCSLTRLDMDGEQQLQDEHLQSIAALQGLSCLEVSGVGDELTDRGLWAVTALTALTFLRVADVTSDAVSQELLPKRGRKGPRVAPGDALVLQPKINKVRGLGKGLNSWDVRHVAQGTWARAGSDAPRTKLLGMCCLLLGMCCLGKSSCRQDRVAAGVLQWVRKAYVSAYTCGVAMWRIHGCCCCCLRAACTITLLAAAAARPCDCECVPAAQGGVCQEPPAVEEVPAGAV